MTTLISIPFSYHSPGTYVDTNVNGTLNVLQTSQELGVRRVVHTSTSEVFGSARFVPITEEHPLHGRSPYSASKIAAVESDGGFGEVVNLGHGFEISIGNTANLIARLVNTEIDIVTDDERLRPAKSEVERFCADNSKAARLINRKPKYGGHDGLISGLSEIIA